MSFYSPHFNPERGKRREKKHCVFSSLSLTTVTEVFAGVILAPFALLGPLASVTPLITAAIAPRWSLFSFIFVCYSHCAPPPWFITPAAQLSNSDSYLTDKHVAGAFETLTCLRVTHLAGTDLENLWAGSWQR